MPGKIDGAKPVDAGKAVIVTVKQGKIISEGQPVSTKDASIWAKEENQKYSKDGIKTFAIPVETGKSTVATFSEKNPEYESNGEPIDKNSAAAAVKESNAKHSKDGLHSFSIDS